MVTQTLIEATKTILGSEPLSILVTGGTGFVGSNVAATLAKAGHRVTVTGRNRFLAPRDTRFQMADIRDQESVLRVCADQQFVIHCASDTSPSKTEHQLHDVNVVGTENVIAGCLEHKTERLVHVSSTSIHFNFADTLDVFEDQPLPAKFACGYAATKAIAEARIQAASARGLNVYTVRARAVFGPRDATLLPRIFHAYDCGRLRRIGDGQNLTELTYIDNLVYGLVLALRRGPAGGVCTITGGHPVRLWELLDEVLKATGRNRSLRRVSYPLALKIAAALEWKHRFLKLPGEPPLTRYSVGLLARSQTFSPSAAQSDLKYEPVVPMSDGIATTLKSISSRDESHARVAVSLKLFSTGYTTAPFNWIEPTQSSNVVRLHAAVGVIDHPEFGVTLFDTGYSPRFYQATKHWPYRLLATATPVETSAALSAANILAARGIDPDSVRRIFVSHFHSDHVCGLADFPNAEVIATRVAWESARNQRGLGAVRRALAPNLIPSDLGDRLCLFGRFLDAGFGPFERCQDLFGDGSVRLIELPGHAMGQFGLLLQTGPDERKLLVADAVWTRRTITENLKLTWRFLAIAAERSAARTSRQKLVELHRRFPQIEIIPTHCPVVASKWKLDATTLLENP